MKNFTIDAENNITVYASRKAARETGAGVFSTEEQFADLIGPDNKRLIEIWNSLPGVKPVTKFTNRKVATERIWKAIQSLGEVAAQPAAEPAPESTVEVASPELPSEPATTLEQPVPTVDAPAADVAPTEASATKKATRTKKPPTGEPTAKAAHEGSKTSRVIEMLKREGGVTLKEIMTEMGWQSHTTRALMSAGGSLAKKHGLTVISTKGENGERTYSIAS